MRSTGASSSNPAPKRRSDHTPRLGHDIVRERGAVDAVDVGADGDRNQGSQSPGNVRPRSPVKAPPSSPRVHLAEDVVDAEADAGDDEDLERRDNALPLVSEHHRYPGSEG